MGFVRHTAQDGNLATTSVAAVEGMGPMGDDDDGVVVAGSVEMALAPMD